MLIPGGIPMGKYTFREQRLLAEYIAKRWPKARVQYRVRVGPEAQGYYIVGAKWADALVETENTIYLVEAKVTKASVAIGQLLYYRKLLPMSPWYPLLPRKPIKLFLLLAVDDPTLRRLAEEDGIETDVYKPDWLEEQMVGELGP
jgi:hypothetical protein